MPIHWNSALETGLRHIDLQHQDLVEMINATEAAHRDGRDAEALQDILPRLTGYVLFHFSTEETLLNSPGVPAEHAAQHRRAHGEFARHVTALKTEAAAGDTVALETLLTYLQRWLVDHIMGTDRELVRQLHNGTP